MPARPPDGPDPMPPVDLTFEVTHRFRPASLVDPGFLAVDMPVVPSRHVVRAEEGPAAPFATVELRVAGLTGSVSCGLATADDQQVLVRCTRRSVLIEVRQAGRTRVVRRRRFAPPDTFGLAFVVCENQVTALVDEGAGWYPVLTERKGLRRLLDLRREDGLHLYRYAWQVDGPATASVRAGVFGGVGLRDPHLVQDADGAPFERDGRRYLTWTVAGLGFFPQAHWSVWSFDPTDVSSLRPEAHLFFRRDGLVLGDHAGQLVRHEGRWLVAVSSWGDFGEGPVHVRHTSSDADLLTGVHVLDTEATPLPTQHGTWDPALLRQDGRWHVAFVESESQSPFVFHPALASTAHADWTAELELSFRVDDSRQCEGPILLGGAGTVWLLASDKETRTYPVRDLTGRLRGRLDAPYTSNIPHPQLVEDPRGGWWLVTFDGTPYDRRVMGYGGHGDVVVMHSTPGPGRPPG